MGAILPSVGLADNAIERRRLPTAPAGREHEAVPRPAAQSASELEFEGLFRQHAPGLLRLIRSRIDDAGAGEDILQETFVRFFRFYVVPGRLDPSRPVGPLLATIAIREAARRGRALGRQRRLDAGGWPATAAPGVGSDDHVAGLHEARVVRAALGRLEPRQRRLLVAWELRRSTESLAVAEQLGVPVLKQVVVRARRNFRQHYRAACAKADGVFATATPTLLGAALRARARLRLETVRYDTFAAGLGLAACAVALVAVDVGARPAHSHTAELVARDLAPAVASIPSGDPPAASITQGRQSLQTPPAPPKADTSAAEPTGVRLDDEAAKVALTTTRPGGETRSINSFTVQCEAGTTGKAVCTAFDLLPPHVSGSGDP